MYKLVEVEVELERQDVIDFLESCSDREYVTILMEVDRGKVKGAIGGTIEREMIEESLIGLAEKVTLGDLDRIEQLKGSTTIQ